MGEFLQTKSIATRLFLKVLLFSISAALILSVFQMYQNYRDHRSSIVKMLDAIEKEDLPSIISSVWVMNRDVISKQIEGILNKSDVIRAGIYVDDALLIEKKKKKADVFISREYPLYHMHENRQLLIGRLIIETSLDIAGSPDSLLARLYQRLLYQTILIFCISFFVFYLLKKSVLDHISFIVRQLRGKNGHEHGLHISLKRASDKNDEIDTLVSTLNTMSAEITKTIESLNLSESHYRGLFEESPIPIWEEDFSDVRKYLDTLRASGVTDFSHYLKNNPGEIQNLISNIKVVNVNNASLKLFQAVSKQDLIGNLGKILTSDSADAIVEGICSLYRGNTSFEGEYQNKNLEGTYLNLNLRWAIVSGYEDTWERVLVSRIDVTALRRTEAYVNSILSSVNEGFIVVDRDFRILSANPAYLRMVGKSEAEVMGEKCHELSHGKFQPCFIEGEDCPVMKTFSSGKSYISNHEHHHHGENIFTEIKSYPLRNSEGEITSVIETITDITEKRKLEEELAKTQKLDSIGVLAGGIAHDFNNILTGILGYISLLKLRADPSLQGYIHEAEKAVEQARSLTHQLLTFAKGGEPVKKLIQILPVVESAVKLALSGTNVKYELGYDADLYTVEADEGQIKQVIQNIVLNAAESMPRGGTVIAGVHNISLSGDTGILKDGNYIKITANDTGMGIPSQYLSSIFDPYFTTKKKGSGLGLATSFSIIKKHGGIIDVTSTVDKGSTFIIYLPATDRTAETKSSIAGIVPGKGRILMLEDEDIVAAVAKELLGALGYMADVEVTGENALHAYLEAMGKGAPYDAVILDLTIRGGMGGRDTMKGLLALNPVVKAIVSSGYAQDPIMANHAEYGFKACLLKPYRIDELSQTLTEVLS